MITKDKNDPRAKAVYDEILSKFPEENDCIRELLKHVTLRCDNCGYADLELNDERYTKCPSCKKLCWFTAQSFFNRVRVPRAYLVALTLLSKGIKINGSGLARLCSISPNTGSAILKKFGVVITRYLERCRHEKVNTAYFKGIIRKRTRLSIAAQHPTFEFYKRALVLNLARGLRARDLKKMSEDARKIYDMLSKKPVTVDAIVEKCGLSVPDAVACISKLELQRLARFEHQTHILKEHPVTTWMAKLTVKKKLRIPVFENLDEISRTFRTIGRKYIQLYLALIWCWNDQKFWSLESLQRAVCKHEYIRSIDLLGYDSCDKVLVYNPI